MSGISSIQPLSVVGVAASSFVGTNTLFKSTNTRSFKSSTVKIVAPCNITEKHSDHYVITEHPTEMGVLISDHMYALPKRVEIQVAYSLAGGVNALKSVGALLGVSKSPKSLQDYYNLFLKLQSDRNPFSITTGKRQYQNMVIESIEETTESKTENLLMINLRCREVIITNTSSYTDTSLQADAPNTASPVNNGTQQTQDGPTTTALPVGPPITSTPL